MCSSDLLEFSVCTTGFFRSSPHVGAEKNVCPPWNYNPNPRFHPFEKDNIATPFIRAVICFFFYTIRAFLTNPQEMRARTTTVHRFLWYFSLPLYDVHSSCYVSFIRVKYPRDPSETEGRPRDPPWPPCGVASF